MVESALEHCRILDDLGFDRYVVSLKDSHPRKVIEANTPLRRPAPRRAAPPRGDRGGDPARGDHQDAGGLRAAPLPRHRRHPAGEPHPPQPAQARGGHGRPGRSWTTSRPAASAPCPVFDDDKLNIISCPSCSRVENEKFVELAEAVKEMTAYAERHALTIAVMGCRVNGPGETDDADLGLWCGPTHVNLKRKTGVGGRLHLRRDPAPAAPGAGRPDRRPLGQRRPRQRRCERGRISYRRPCPSRSASTISRTSSLKRDLRLPAEDSLAPCRGRRAAGPPRPAGSTSGPPSRTPSSRGRRRRRPPRRNSRTEWVSPVAIT